MRPQQPAIQQRSHTVGQRQPILPHAGFRPHHSTLVAQRRQSPIAFPIIRAHGAAGCHRLFHRRCQAGGAGVGHAGQANAPDSSRSLLNQNLHQSPARRAPTAFAGARGADIDFISFHNAFQPIPPGAHHRAPQLVQPVSRGVVAAPSKHPLQAQRAGPVFLVGHLPPRLEPKSQGQIGVREQRSRSDRGLMLAAGGSGKAFVRSPQRRDLGSVDRQSRPANAAWPSRPERPPRRETDRAVPAPFADTRSFARLPPLVVT